MIDIKWKSKWNVWYCRKVYVMYFQGSVGSNIMKFAENYVGMVYHTKMFSVKEFKYKSVH